MPEAIWMKISCPNRKCDSYGDRKQWAKADCGHANYLDTDLDVYCHKKCRWPSGKIYVFIADLHWDCSACKTSTKHTLKTISRSLLKIMAGLAKSGQDTQEERDILAAIIDKCADRI